PFESFNIQSFCGKSDCRHVSAVLGERAGLRDPITVHNLYVPAGGDLPDSATNPKFAHKLAFLEEMRASAALRCHNSSRMILLGDLNVAPLEHDVGAISRCYGSCLTHRSSARSSSPPRRRAAGSMPCACGCPNRRSS